MARSSSSRPRTPVVDRGGVYLVSLDPTARHEQRDRRPVLVISPAAFNRITRVPIVVPITTRGNFARVAGLTVSLAESGTRTVGIVRCDQPRALDLEARSARKIDNLPASIVDEVMARVIAILA